MRSSNPSQNTEGDFHVKLVDYLNNAEDLGWGWQFEGSGEERSGEGEEPRKRQICREILKSVAALETCFCSTQTRQCTSICHWL